MDDNEEHGRLSRHIKQNYFIAVKSIYGIILMSYIVMQYGEGPHDKSVVLVMSALCFSLSCVYETAKAKRAAAICELAITVLCVKLFDGGFIFMLPSVLSDAAIEFKLPFYFRFAPMIGIFFADDKLMYFILCMFTVVIYIQHYDMIIAYRHLEQDYEEQERFLKDSIDSKSREFKEEIQRTGLRYENIVLQDKAALSQELHDKLGHRINGSIYQLEACRMLIESDTSRAADILTRVIESLRTGMDEIRAVLRREKPDGRRMTHIKLANLCEECRVQYGIEASLEINGDTERVRDEIWNVILDNCCECVTNSLKYSGCSEIRIKINILNKMIRCNVSDNGNGCDKISDSMGLQGIKHRIALLGGTTDIDGSLGFSVNMLIPIGEG